MRGVKKPGRGNLPLELTSFVGRNRELAQIKTLFGRSRLVTVTGVGGVGKSRLALEAATRFADSFDGGAWNVELARVGDPRQITDTVAQTLGVVGRDGEPIEHSLITRLHGRPCLILLDNCEHLVAGCRDFAATMLRECANARILATSREPLALAGEATLGLSPLDLPTEAGATTTPAALRRFSGIRLFVARAQAADPTFELAHENAHEVAEICRAVAGIPLGLELAAVRVRSLSLSELLARLDDPLSLANLASPDDARHATLMSTLDASHDLLLEPERILWRRLSVFASSFTLASATHVTANLDLPPGTIFDSLTSLVEKSIITRAGSEGSRYRLLEPVRLYGLDRLRAAGEERKFRKRHREWCGAIAAGEAPWWTGRDQLRWIQELNDEQAEIHSALNTVIQSGDAEEGLRLIADCWPAYIVRDRHRIMRRQTEELLEHENESTIALAQALHAAAYMAVTESDFVAARAHGDACERISVQQSFAREAGLAHFVLGLVDLFEFQEGAARERFRRARDLLAPTDAQIVYAAVLNLLAGHADFTEAEPERSLQLLEESLALLESTDDLWMKSMAYQRLGRFQWLREEWYEAERSHRTGLRLQLELGYRFGIAFSLEELAWLAFSTRRLAHAAQLLGAAEALRRDLTASLGVRMADHHAEVVRATRTSLGLRRFTALHGQGENLDSEAAAALALGEPIAVDETQDDLGPLTPREHQVASLIAEGHTNPEIATVLLVTRHTVKTYVQRIMRKLGVQSRTEIAVWMAEHRTPHLH